MWFLVMSIVATTNCRKEKDVPYYWLINTKDKLNCTRKNQQNFINEMMTHTVGRGELCLLCQRYRCRRVKNRVKEGASSRARACVALPFSNSPNRPGRDSDPQPLRE